MWCCYWSNFQPACHLQNQKQLEHSHLLHYLLQLRVLHEHHKLRVGDHLGQHLRGHPWITSKHKRAMACGESAWGERGCKLASIRSNIQSDITAFCRCPCSTICTTFLHPAGSAKRKEVRLLVDHCSMSESTQGMHPTVCHTRKASPTRRAHLKHLQSNRPNSRKIVRTSR